MNPLDKDYRFTITLSGRAVARLLPIAFSEKLSVRQILQRLVTNYSLTLPPHGEHVHGHDLWRMWRTKHPLPTWPRWMLQQLFRYEWGEGALEQALRDMEQEALEVARKREASEIKANRPTRYLLVRRGPGGGYERIFPRGHPAAQGDELVSPAFEAGFGQVGVVGDPRPEGPVLGDTEALAGEESGPPARDPGGAAGPEGGASTDDRQEFDAGRAELSDPQREDGESVGEAGPVLKEHLLGHGGTPALTGISLRDLVLRDFGPSP